MTPIYHPNVDEKGLMCLPIVNADNWKPATKVEQGNRGSHWTTTNSWAVLSEILDRIAAPDPDHAVREDVGALFTKDRAKFDKVLPDS